MHFSEFDLPEQEVGKRISREEKQTLQSKRERARESERERDTYSMYTRAWGCVNTVCRCLRVQETQARVRSEATHTNTGKNQNYNKVMRIETKQLHQTNEIQTNNQQQRHDQQLTSSLKIIFWLARCRSPFFFSSKDQKE